MYDDGSHIGIGITLPEARMHIFGAADETQLIVQGGTGQSNLNPLIRLRAAGGAELMNIHSDSPDNAFVGLGAGLENEESNGATYNTFVGPLAAGSNTIGNNLTAIGHSALFTNIDGVNNTAIGSQAMFSNTQGAANFAGGFLAMYTNSTGSNNVAIGNQTLFLNSNGSTNTAVGAEAASFNQSGSNNSLYGYRAMQTSSSASFSTAIGANSLLNTTVGGNTALGYAAGGGFANGTNSTFIGYNADGNLAGYSNSSCLGYNSRVTASNQVRLGNSTVTSIGGFVDWSNVSDGRIKRNVKENVRGLDFILKLRPVTYTLDVSAIDRFVDPQGGKMTDKDGREVEGRGSDPGMEEARREKSQIRYTGFIAQEVEAVAKQSDFDFSGIDKPKNENDLYGLRYSEFVVPVVKAIQEQQEIISRQQQQIEELLRRIEQLENKQ
jgi:hypothetical protein